MTEDDWQRRYEASTGLLDESQDEVARLKAEVSRLKSEDNNGCFWALALFVLSGAIGLVAVAATAWAWAWGGS